jgi:NAD(P)-dependent dehydrogenase (short-subunit alcohol dehydrogenase family)
MNIRQKYAVVTGANSGIGYFTAKGILDAGYKCLLLMRDSEKSEKALEDLQRSYGTQMVEHIAVDLSLMSSVRAAIQEIKKRIPSLDILVNNAGLLSNNRQITEEGHELTIAVNYLAPALLAEKLVSLFTDEGGGRILQVTSALYKNGKIPFSDWHQKGSYGGTKAYSNTKMMMVIHMLDMAHRLKGSSVCINALHPGVIASDIFRDFPAIFREPLLLFLKKANKGAEPSLYLALSKELNGISGQYFHEKKQKKLNSFATDSTNRERLMEYTRQVLEL